MLLRCNNAHWFTGNRSNHKQNYISVAHYQQLDAKAFHFAVNMPQSEVDICADTLHCLQPNVATQILCIRPT